SAARRGIDGPGLAVAEAGRVVAPAARAPGAGEVIATAGSASVVNCRMVSPGPEAAEPITCTGHVPGPTAAEAARVKREVSPDDTSGGSNLAFTPGGSPVADSPIRSAAPEVTRVDTRTAVVPRALSRARAGSTASAKPARPPTAT